MELPNKTNAIVPIAKITDYLLSETHAVGKSKARFFRSFGFDDANISEFQQALTRLAQTGSVSEINETAYGKKYVVDGELETPNGDMIRLRTVWIIETDETTPRLVTAHPLN